MSHLQPSFQQEPIDVRQLARAIRFALVAIVLSVSYFGLRSSLSIGQFGAIFNDMLAGRPLPAITVFVLKAKLAFVAVSILLPTAAVATLFQRRVVASFYVIGGLSVLAIVQFVVLYHALSAPLVEVIKGMSNP